jgi:hypothetical protein
MLIQIALGLIYANVSEGLIHEHILHGWGKKKGSFWSFHWADHHRASRKNDMYDVSYTEGFFHHKRIKESVSTILLLLAHSVLLPFAPWFVLATWVYGITYLWAHRKSHLDVPWGKKWMPWHRDHHLGVDQDQNWCVLFPWTDWLRGTRKKG